MKCYLHGECLPRACLAVGKDANVVTIHARGHKGLHLTEHLMYNEKGVVIHKKMQSDQSETLKARNILSLVKDPLAT